MKKFLKKISLLTAMLLIIYVLLFIYVNFVAKDPTALYEFLYEYQVNKLNTKKKINTVFVGDSSLGNAIDSDYFSEYTGLSSINLALTGLYGYAGSYNMIKKCYAKHKNLKNIVIMQSLDMQTREVSYRGYRFTMTDYSDFNELLIVEKKKIVLDYLDFSESLVNILTRKISGSDNKNFEIENDYVKQGPQIKLTSTVEPFLTSKIVNDKMIFLKKIKIFCDKKNLNLIYMHGPFYKEKVECSNDYISTIDSAIRAIEIPFIDTLLKVSANELGDTHEHILQEFKQAYTKKYADILKEKLVH